MNKILLSILTVAILLVSSPSAMAYTRVRGYTSHKGTYVQPYRRTTRNSTKADNWSAKGNVNPYTGTKGHKRTY